MTLRSKLFATVALPVLTVSFALSPAMARSQSTGWVVAQAENEAPAAGDDEEQLKKKKAAEEAPAEEPAAPAEEAPAAPAEEAPAAPAEEAPAPAEEAPAAPAEEAPAPAEEAPAAPAEEAPAPAEEAPAAPAEEAPAAPAEEAPAPAEEAPAAPAEEAPAKQKEKPAAAEKKSEKAKNKKKDKGKKAAEPKAEEPAAEEPAPAAEEPAAPAAEEPAAPAAEEPAAPAAEEPAAPAAAEPAAPAEEQPVQPKAETETPAQPDAATDETQPATDAPATAEEKPLTQEQKATIAADPSKTTDTVVLPVDNGAAVLDSDKDADPAASQTRSQARQQEEVVAAPKTDADAQAEMPVLETKAVNAAIKEKGEKVSEAPQFAVSGVDPAAAAAGTTTTNNVTNNTVNNTVTNNTVTNNTVVNNVTQVSVVEQVKNTTVLNVGDRIVARSDDRPRLRMDSSESYYEQLSRNRTRETIVRENGSRIVTIYNPYGDVIQRSRISADGDEYVMIYAPEADTEEPRRIYDAGYDLPPMRLTVPVDDYIISTSEEPREDYYTFLEKPPVERVERVYSIDEVKYSARIRDKVRRIDLDTITFATGSAEVPLAQAKTLRKVADAMNKVLKKDPGETFLIEGHTDAVGSDKSNLVLSDQRASSVASLLTDVYGIPPENLTTQGYGERYLKIKTETAEQQNRRVTIRRVTALIRPVAKAK